ncbi:MAG: hypothetical protein P8J33_01415, partial [Pirellulaceae bacterium]|nr:hypothetical protein [Pirellulaceae bacterium]
TVFENCLPNVATLFSGGGYQADITEDSSSEFAKATHAADVILTSAEGITDATDSSINISGHLQLNAQGFDVWLGDGTSSLVTGTVGVLANNATLNLEGPTEIDGREFGSFIIDNNPGGDFSDNVKGTKVDGTLFIRSTDSVGQVLEVSGPNVGQTTGSLDAGQIGIDAGGHVFLYSVNINNTAIAVKAGDFGTLATTTLAYEYLQEIAAAEGYNSVRGNDPQAVVVLHEGNLVIGEVADAIQGGKLQGVETSTGPGNSGGSIFIVGNDNIDIKQNIIGMASSDNAQVNAYVVESTGSISLLNDSIIQVNSGANEGIANQTHTIGFAEPEKPDYNVIVFKNGAFTQTVEIKGGYSGEQGYRFGVLWDVTNTGNNPPGNYVQPPSEYLPEAGDATEFIFVGTNPVNRETYDVMEGGEFADFTKTYSVGDLVAHLKQPTGNKICSDVFVLNDQNINFFVTNADDTLDNDLNQVQITVEAQYTLQGGMFEAPEALDPLRQPETRVNSEAPDNTTTPVEIVTPDLDSESVPFTGSLKFALVKVDAADLILIGEELRLKDPTIVYESAQDDIIELPNEIKPNDLIKIYQAIEENPEAEAGYWYKVLNDKDELLFYYLKKGSAPIEDVGPESDFGTSNEEASSSDNESTGDPVGEQDGLSQISSWSGSDLLLADTQRYVDTVTVQPATMAWATGEEANASVEAEPLMPTESPSVPLNQNSGKEDSGASPDETTQEYSSTLPAALLMSTFALQRHRNRNQLRRELEQLKNTDDADKSTRFKKLDRLRRRILQK